LPDGDEGAAPAKAEGEALAALPQIESLRRDLEAAFAEIDETRNEAARLQDERDEAIRATDEVRLELQAEVESARDETFEVQGRVDEMQRELNDARDEARDEAMRLTEEIDDLRRQLDERTEEVRRLRDRLDEFSDEIKHSQPPPPGPVSELDAARREVKWLRQQLIETKRKMSAKAGPTDGKSSAGKPSAGKPPAGKSPWRPPPRRAAGEAGGAEKAAEVSRADGVSEGSLEAPKVPEING
jgi:chromosome segregation ATPase